MHKVDSVPQVRLDSPCGIHVFAATCSAKPWGGVINLTFMLSRCYMLFSSNSVTKHGMWLLRTACEHHSRQTGVLCFLCLRDRETIRHVEQGKHSFAYIESSTVCLLCCNRSRCTAYPHMCTHEFICTAGRGIHPSHISANTHSTVAHTAR